jgi:hypothetical protein
VQEAVEAGLITPHIHQETVGQAAVVREATKGLRLLPGLQTPEVAVAVVMD